MKTCSTIILKFALVIFAALSCAACGIKAAPVPKDSIHVPVPVSIVTEIADEAIVIYNENTSYSLLVERAEQSSSGVFRSDYYKRLALILPGNSYRDTEVEKNAYYTYKFSYYDAKTDVFSNSATKTLRYVTPVSLSEVYIEEMPESACVIVKASSAVNYAVLSVNGKDMGEINDGKSCFNLPNSLNVGILIIPYDFSNTAGIPYTTTLKRNPETVLLPPQNIKTVREKTKIIISWDIAPNATEYNIYLDNKGKLTLLEATDISLYAYSDAKLKGCVKFSLSTMRGNKESSKVSVESCP